MKSIFLKIIFVIFFINGIISAQIIYTPLKSNVYKFLDRVSQKVDISYYDIVKPISRKKIASYLKLLSKKTYKLSRVDKQDLNWYKKEYSYELYGYKKRWRLFEYSDSLFRIFLTPIIDAKINSLDGNKNWKTSRIGRFDGSLQNNIGFSFSITDNSEGGDSIDAFKKFSPFTGFNHKTASDGTISFEDVNAILTYDWSWGSISVGKDFVNWGSGRNGKLIFSSKSPSFPFIRFEISPAKWLKFHYMHAWLGSNVPDSSTFYRTTVTKRNGEPVYRGNQRNKYIAANFISIIPSKRFIFSFGNSIVYSDGSVKLPYLIPFIWYYKSVDHNFYNSIANDGYGNNQQLFFDLSLRYPSRFHIYSTLFIDEFSLTKFLKGDHSRDQLGYTVGLTNYGSISDNLMLEIEYTKIMPGTYLNYIQTQTYENNSYNLGHWIGQNSDQFYFGISYQVMRGFNAKLYYERLRKGGAQRGTDYLGLGNLNFLYSPVSKWNYLGAKIDYELFYDLNLRADFRYVDFTEDNGKGNLRNKTSVDFGVGLSYGIY